MLDLYRLIFAIVSRDIELRLKELQAVGLFTCLCFLGAVIDLILN